MLTIFSHLERHQKSFKHKRLAAESGIEEFMYETSAPESTEYMECGK